MLDQNLEVTSNHMILLDNLRSYCLWAHPFIKSAQNQPDDEDQSEEAQSLQVLSRSKNL